MLSPHICTKLIWQYFKYAQEPQGVKTFVAPPPYRLNYRSRARAGIDKKQTCSFFDIFQRSQIVCNTIGLTYRMFIKLGVRNRDCLSIPIAFNWRRLAHFGRRSTRLLNKCLVLGRNRFVSIYGWCSRCTIATGVEPSRDWRGGNTCVFAICKYSNSVQKKNTRFT